jgi:hypothetical protein
MWWKIGLAAVVGLAVVTAAAIVLGATRWESSTRDLHARLAAAQVPMAPATYDPRELEGLPAPVRRYFRTVLQEGQPLVVAASLAHEGTFNMGEGAERWIGFTSTQRVVTRRPGFVWDARMAMMPGVPVRVHDAYVAGEGILHATLFGLVPLVNLRGTPEVAEGELMRYLAEAPWYPTALLPSQGVRWDGVDDTSAQATFTDGPVTLTMLFRFDRDGLIGAARAAARGRTVGKAVIPTPWEGRWTRYDVRDGMRVPTDGEVAWILPEGPWPYWRGRITSLAYEFAR